MRNYEKYNFFGKISLFLLFIFLILLIGPVEHPGSTIWTGQSSHWVYTFRFLKLSIPGTVAFLFFLFSLISWLKTPISLRNKNYFKILPPLFSFMILFGYIATIKEAMEININTLGVTAWRYILEAFFVFYGLTFLLDTKEKFFKLLELLSILCACAIIYGLIRYFLFGGIGGIVVAKVVFWENAKLKIFLFVISIIGGYIFLEKGNLPYFRFPKYLHIIIVSLCMLTIILSARRSSLVGTIILIFLLLIWGFFHKKALRSITFAVIGALIFSAFSIYQMDIVQEKIINRVNTLSSIFTGDVQEGDTLKGHLNDLRLGVSQVKKNPFWGVGFNIKGEDFRDRELGGEITSGKIIGWVHNGFLTMWIRFGIIGAFVYVILYLKIFSSHYLRYRETKDNVFMLLFFFFLLLFAHELFFPPFSQHFKDSIIIFGALGLTNAYINIARRAAKE